jgi:hypothetical protein
MSEFGGSEMMGPGEGGSSAPEQLSEEAKQRFAAAARAMQQIQREEKRARKRDDQVARTIMQFLGQDEYMHLFQLIAKLVARDCPSIFILAVISLIHKGCREAVEEYLQDARKDIDLSDNRDMSITSANLPEDMNKILIIWISRLQLVVSLDPTTIIDKLLVDEHNLDGTILQLSSFVVNEFFSSYQRSIPFESLQSLTASILQTVFEPFVDTVKRIEKSDEQEA